MLDLCEFDDLLTSDEREIRLRVREFCDDKILPGINYYWERAEFPRDLIKEFGDLAVVGGAISGYGCPGMSVVAEGLVATECARADGSVRDTLAAHGLAMTALNLLGGEDQKQHWLPRMAKLESIGAFPLTEANHGSDAASLETSAHVEADQYVLNGQKRWITNGSVADIAIIWARDESNQIGGFIVEPHVPGFTAEVMRGKTACRAADHAIIRLRDVRVPLKNRLPGATDFRALTQILVLSRLAVAWEAMGHALGAYEVAQEFALGRSQFGQPLARFQLVQSKLATMAVALSTMQLICWRVARLAEAGGVKPHQSSAAKLHCAQMARKVILDARDILGGNGVLLENHIARHHVDIEAAYTYEGTHDMNALIIGRSLTGLSAFSIA